MTAAVVRVMLAVAMLLALVRGASAEDAETRVAKRYFEKGQKLFALGKFDQALEEYQAAYDAKPIPDILFNIGQCYRNLGDFEAAIFSFKKYLKLTPRAENRELVEDYITELEAEQDKDAARRLQLREREERERERERQERREEREARRKDNGDEAGDPVYTKWWFWTGLLVVGAAGGAGAYYMTRPDEPPDTSLGNIVFTQ